MMVNSVEYYPIWMTLVSFYSYQRGKQKRSCASKFQTVRLTLPGAVCSVWTLPFQSDLEENDGELRGILSDLDDIGVILLVSRRQTKRSCASKFQTVRLTLTGAVCSVWTLPFLSDLEANDGELRRILSDLDDIGVVLLVSKRQTKKVMCI